MEVYDAPRSLACIAPRPLLILNGELDPRCPIPGLTEAVDAARPVYEAAGAGGALALSIHAGVGHEETPAMADEARAWLDAQLRRPGDAWK